MSKNLTPDQVSFLPKSLIQVGVPLPFPVYDIRGQLLLQEGSIVNSEDQMERLLERGLYLDKKTVERLPGGNNQPKAGDSKKKKEEEEEEKEKEPDQKLVNLSLRTIKLGESIQITPLSDESNSTKYIVKFLGGADKGSIICTPPKVDDKLVFVKEHSGFLVRLFSGREVYNFTTTVEAVYNRPYPHMHLKFPRSVYAKNIRNNQRIETNIITSLLNKQEGEFNGKKSAGRIVDISLGGAMIEGKSIAGALNDEIECTFKLMIHNKEILFSIPSVLRSITEPSGADGAQTINHGIQFKEIPFQEKVLLQNFIYQLIAGANLENL